MEEKMDRAVLYVRVSSKEQSEKGYSIPAQRKLLIDYAEKLKLSVVRQFEEVESAKAAGRTEFEKMIAFLRGNEKVEHILVEKTDRLTRNFRDLVAIDDLGRTIHFVKEGQIIGKDARQSDKLMYGIKVVIAKSYIDQLSEETRKGMLEKAEQGLYPSWAPLGYVNNAETRGIDIDFSRAGIIRELFEIYSGGTVSLLELTKIARAKGLRSRKGNPVYPFQIDNMLKNPVYVGDFKWKGVYYRGKHNGIISRDLFERAQQVRESRRWAKPFLKQFAFRGLVKCGHCGGVMSPFEKKGTYVYYRCTKYRGKCPEKGIREERLAELLGEPLKRLRMNEERLEWIKAALSESFGDEQRFAYEEKKKLEAENQEIERKISALYEDKLAGLVDGEFWKRKYAEYRRKQDSIEELIARHKHAGINYLEDSNRILELAQNSYALYITQDNFEKRKLVNLILWNSVIRDGALEYELRKPFDMLADGIEEEKKQIAEKVPLEDRNKNWLLR
jgi:site-specific DNA recombinase